MNTPQWERAKEIFDAALDLEPDQWAGYLLRECGDDTALRHEVESLLKADADAGSFLNPNWLAPFTPFAVPVPQPDFQLVPGDVVSDRFEIIRPLGDGGMGRVYEAHDSVLGVRVALKTLRPEISSNPEVLFRFRQEVRIAHRITHPNVCRTFHLDHELRQIGPDETSSIDLTFLTMEFLQGETLRQVLKRTGRIAPAQALPIAQQMAEAIEAAHQTGIVHRDIKPGNVMICPMTFGSKQEARVVITDFGLAKFEAGTPNNDISSISQPGRAMGTLSYMSPEQLQGRDVGPATDVYAFGLVLYEMVTGIKAFPDSTTMAAAYRRTTEPPPSPRAIAPDLPPAWETAILGCLQIDPAARFQNASDVIAILDGTTPHSSRSRTLQRTKSEKLRLSRGKMPVIVLTPIVLMALFFLAFRFYTARADATVAPGTLVYLAPVKNETGEKQLDNVTELVQAGVSQSAHINLLDSRKAGDYLHQMTKSPDASIDATTAREIAMRAGAPRVVFASVTGASGSYKLNVDIQQTDNDPSRYRDHWSHSWDWHNAANTNSNTISPELLKSVRNASDWVRHTVGESENDIARLDVPPADVTTDNWQALAAFAESEKLDEQHKKWQAALALQNAVKIDPHFSIAYARLGDILFAINHDTEGRAAYKNALDSSTERSLSRKELDRIQGTYAVDTNDYETAIQAFRDYAAFYPNDYIGWVYPTGPLRALKRNEEDLANLRKAVALAPHNSFPLMALATELLLVRKPDDARHWIEELRKSGSEPAALEVEGSLEFLAYNFAAAAQAFEKLKQSDVQSRRARSYRLLLRLAAEQGDYAKAIELANEGLAEDRAEGESPTEAFGLLDRADLECHIKNYRGCMDDVHQALTLDTSPRVLSETEDVLGPALPTAPRQYVAEFRREFASIEAKIPENDPGFDIRLLRLRVHGETLLAEGKTEAALVEMQKVAALDAPANSREYLGRAFVDAANSASSEEAAQTFLEQALTAYSAMVQHPELIWVNPSELPPGLLTDQTEAYLRVATRLRKSDAGISNALTLYSRLRKQPFDASSELQHAQHFFSQVSEVQSASQH